MQTEVFRRLDESSVSPVFWDLPDVKTALNEGYEEISEAAEWFETNQIVGFTQDNTYHNIELLLTNDPLTVRAVWNSQTLRWMWPTTVRELDTEMYPHWQKVTGAPEYWFMRGLSILGVFPKPPASTGTMEIWGTAMPVALSANGDTPAFPREFHYGLVEYALYDLLVQDVETKEAIIHYNEYLRYEDGLRKHVQERTRDRVRRHG